MRYGIPYQGSKSQIVEEVIKQMPRGKRFCDLFGGGFAVSHYALLSGKYESVYYNELNPLLEPFIRDVINGKYSPKVFVPKFITRQEFMERKDKDAYVKYLWSFGNNGIEYLYGKDKEFFKEQAHNFLVFGDKKALEYLQELYKKSYYWHLEKIYIPNNWVESRKFYVNIMLKLESIRICVEYGDQNVYNQFKDMNFLDFYKMPNKKIVDAINKFCPDIPKKEYKSVKDNTKLSELKQLGNIKFNHALCQLQNLERIESVQRVASLERLERLGEINKFNNLEIHTGSYLDYEYKDGDIVYLDPPYEGTEGYSDEIFNHKEFYDWCASRPYQVWFSSYDISDNRFYEVFRIKKFSLFDRGGNGKVAIERVYSNRPYKQELVQGELF